MVRVAQSKLQLGVVLDTRASSLLVAVVVPSRIAPGTTVDKSQVKWALWSLSHSAVPALLVWSPSMPSSQRKHIFLQQHCVLTAFMPAGDGRTG